MARAAKKSGFGWEHIKAFCETLTDAEDALTREMVSRISDKWSLWTMSVIAESGETAETLDNIRHTCQIYQGLVGSMEL